MGEHICSQLSYSFVVSEEKQKGSEAETGGFRETWEEGFVGQSLKSKAGTAITPIG